jgi:outer membrane protein OmpA-like peptidoglycan-associated protein
MGASACSTVPDWVDPTTWVGGNDDQTTSAPADQGTAAPANGGTAQTADNTQTPDLSTIPDKPATPSTSDEQKQVADSLAADRSRAQYSGDALRGGTEPAAAPPPADAPPATEDLASNSDNNAAAPAPTPAPPPLPPAAGPGTLPADNSAAPAPSAPAPAAPEAAPTTQVATLTQPPAAAPAVSPAVPNAPPALSMNPSDAQLGFRPSSAPPLDASVAQFVAPSILSRYQQTASIGPQPAVPSTMPSSGDTTTAYAMNTPASQKRARRRQAQMGMGGPEAMSGAVVANFDSLQAGAAAQAAYAAGSAPAAVVFFRHDTTVLSGEAKAQVRDAARAFMARGGQGYVRVIGHSSSRTANMSSERHLVWNFERSEARANAVARALIREGVPADKVLVQAVGDDQPVYTESMPQGEDGNRRAEIFFQS